MMNNFMASNLPQTFYNQASINNVRGGSSNGDTQNAYNYDINLNQVNKGANSSQAGFNGRMSNNDYENGSKNYFMNIKDKQGIGNGNNIIIEQDAENNEDESYYLNNSPPRRGKSNNKAQAMLSNNSSNFGVENAGNQQNH